MCSNWLAACPVRSLTHSVALLLSVRLLSYYSCWCISGKLCGNDCIPMAGSSFTICPGGPNWIRQRSSHVLCYLCSESSRLNESETRAPERPGKKRDLCISWYYDTFFHVTALWMRSAVSAFVYALPHVIFIMMFSFWSVLSFQMNFLSRNNSTKFCLRFTSDVWLFFIKYANLIQNYFLKQTVRETWIENKGTAVTLLTSLTDCKQKKLDCQSGPLMCILSNDHQVATPQVAKTKSDSLPMRQWLHLIY